MEIRKESINKQENRSAEIIQSKEMKRQLKLQISSCPQISQMTPHPYFSRRLKFFSPERVKQGSQDWEPRNS